MSSVFVNLLNNSTATIRCVPPRKLLKKTANGTKGCRLIFDQRPSHHQTIVFSQNRCYHPMMKKIIPVFCLLMFSPWGYSHEGAYDLPSEKPTLENSSLTTNLSTNMEICESDKKGRLQRMVLSGVTSGINTSGINVMHITISAAKKGHKASGALSVFGEKVDVIVPLVVPSVVSSSDTQSKNTSKNTVWSGQGQLLSTKGIEHRFFVFNVQNGNKKCAAEETEEEN